MQQAFCYTPIYDRKAINLRAWHGHRCEGAAENGCGGQKNTRAQRRRLGQQLGAGLLGLNCFFNHVIREYQKQERRKVSCCYRADGRHVTTETSEDPWSACSLTQTSGPGPHVTPLKSRPLYVHIPQVNTCQLLLYGYGLVCSLHRCV